jgi:catechol 2,3-dioxygenase-like lactoylglutathione lyase family enzyme
VRRVVETMLSKLEHFLVMTHDVDATRDFYRDVLGFQEGFRPDLGFLGHWLYLGDTPVIHIADWTTYTAHSKRLGIPVTRPANGTGPLDHVAFNGTDAGYDGMRARLDQHRVKYHPHDSLAIGLRQIFLDDPNGLKLELNFWSSARS